MLLLRLLLLLLEFCSSADLVVVAVVAVVVVAVVVVAVVVAVVVVAIVVDFAPCRRCSSLL